MNSKGTPNNLRPPWGKGEPSPNPSGRSKRLPISDTYAQIATQPISESVRRVLKRKGLPLQSGATFADAVVLGVMMKALLGDSRAAKEVRESIEGKAGQRAEKPGNNEPVNIRVVYDQDR